MRILKCAFDLVTLEITGILNKSYFAGIRGGGHKPDEVGEGIDMGSMLTSLRKVALKGTKVTY